MDYLLDNCATTRASILPEVNQLGAGNPFREIVKQTALDGLIQDVKYEPVRHPQKNLVEFMGAVRSTITPLLQQALEAQKGVTFWVSLQVKYAHPTKEITDLNPPHLHSGKRRLTHEGELQSILDEIDQAILIRNAHYNRENSGLVLSDILNFRFKISDFTPLKGRGYQELPQFLLKKHAIINVKNQDTRCFGYAVRSALEPAEPHSDRISAYILLFQKYRLDTIKY